MHPNSYDVGTPDSIKTAFPSFLQPYININQWAIIIQSFRKAHNDATCFACSGEWCCCFFTGFVCIFCFHPPLYLFLRDQMLNDAVRQANNFYFNGNLVFYTNTSGNIYINMAALPPINIPVAAPMPQPVGMMQPIHPQAAGSQITYASAVPYTAQAVSTPQYGAPPPQYGAPPPQYGAPPPQYAPVVVTQSVPPQTSNKYEEVDAPPQYGTAPPLPAPAPSSSGGGHIGQYVVPPEVPPGSQVQLVTPAGHTILLNIPKEATTGSVIQYSY